MALAYATFVVFQILTLLASGHRIDIGPSGTSIYLLVGLVTYTLTEKMVYKEIKNENYARYFTVFLFASGVSLCLKSIL